MLAKSRLSSRLIGVAAVSVVLAAGSAGLAPAAHATAGPTNAFTEESSSSQGGTTDTIVDTALGDTVGATASGGTITVTASKPGGTTTTATLKPPNGSTFTDTDYSITNSGTAPGASLTFSPAPTAIASCSPTGTLTITDVTITGTTVTSLAADYYLQCASGSSVSGSVRINSTAPYEVLTQTPVGSVSFGSSAVGQDATKTLTLTASGTSDVTLGAASLSGGNGTGVFSLSDDTCAEATVDAGSSCTVTVHFQPADAVSYATQLEYVADTPLGHRTINLSGAGALPPSAPTNLHIIPGDDGADLTWSPPSSPNGTITGYDVYRDTGSGLTKITSVSTTQYADALASGTDASYAVSAVNAAGEGPQTTPVATTILSRVATPGDVDALSVDADPGVFSNDSGNHVVDPAAATSVSPRQVVIGGTADGDTIGLTIGTTLGDTYLTAGNYDTTTTGDSTHPAMALSVGDQDNCSNGVLDLTDADFHADGSPDVLTGHYSLECNDSTTVTGEIRIDSTSSYSAASASPATLSPASPVGDPATASSVTITNTGTTSESLGSATVSGADHADYSLSNDTCSNTTLTTANHCTLDVDFTPSAGGVRNAELTVPDSTPRGSRTVELTGVGQVPATAPQDFTATPAAGRVDLAWSAPSDSGGSAVTGYDVLRGPDAGDLTVVHSTSADATGYVDTTVAVGRTYTYEVRADTAVANGEPTSALPATARGSEIVYDEDTEGYGVYDIYAAAADGSDPVPVVTGGGSKGQPVVSPDGTKVAYSQQDDDGTHIYVARIDGTGTPVQLTSGAFDDEDPSWSPDGTTIAFDRLDSGDIFDNTAVYTVAASGGSPTELSDAQQGYRPSWTPDGESIVFAGLRGSTDGIDVVPSDGSGGRHLIPGTAGGADPEVSPNGTQVAFVASSGTTYNPGDCVTAPIARTHLDVISIKGGTPTAITSTTSSQFDDDPSWWPDGSAISYAIHTTCSAPGTIATHAMVTNGPTGLFTAGDDVDEPSVNVAPAMPRPVTDAAATLGNGAVYLTWTPSPLPSDLGPGSIVIRRSAPGGGAPSSPTAGTAVYNGTASAALVTGLTTGKTYAFSIFRLDSTGSASEATTIKATPLATPAVHAAAISATASATLGFPVTWSDSPGTPASYYVLAGPVGSALKTLSVSTTKTSATIGPKGVSQGQTWHAVVLARDAFGNLTTAGLATITVPYDDTSSKLHYSHGWSKSHSKSDWLGTAHVSHKKGSTMTATLTGTTLLIIGGRATGDGSFTVTVDGKKARTVNTHAAGTKTRQVLWTSKKLKAGKHTVKITVAGTKHHPAISIDAVAATT